MVPYPVGHRKRDGFIASYETACVERERFFSRTNWTAAVAEALASEALGPEDRAMTLRYDQSEHPLLDAFCDLVGERHLATVHNRWPAHDRARSHLEEKRALLAPLTVPSAKRDAFEETYDRLVREVVLPAIAKRRRRARAACHANDDERYPYAAFPRARARQPSSFRAVGCHVDSTYGHGPCSTNCWLPLAKLDARGRNSLRVESAPGEEDFEPVSADVGEIRVFDGSARARRAVANARDETRVSLDFRVVPESLCAFDASRDGSEKAARYRVGEYFSAAAADASGAFRRVVLGAPRGERGFPRSDDARGRGGGRDGATRRGLAMHR